MKRYVLVIALSFTASSYTMKRVEAQRVMTEQEVRLDVLRKSLRRVVDSINDSSRFVDQVVEGIHKDHKSRVFGNPELVAVDDLRHYLKLNEDFMHWEDEYGNTFLHRLASFSSNEEIMRMVLGLGQDLSKTNVAGKTVNDIATDVGNYLLSDLLAEYEAHPWVTISAEVRNNQEEEGDDLVVGDFSKNHDDSSSSWLSGVSGYFAVKNIAIAGITLLIAHAGWKKYRSSVSNGTEA